jgi:hypothetical protein
MYSIQYSNLGHNEEMKNLFPHNYNIWEISVTIGYLGL